MPTSFTPLANGSECLLLLIIPFNLLHLYLVKIQLNPTNWNSMYYFEKVLISEDVRTGTQSLGAREESARSKLLSFQKHESCDSCGTMQSGNIKQPSVRNITGKKTRPSKSAPASSPWTADMLDMVFTTWTVLPNFNCSKDLLQIYWQRLLFLRKRKSSGIWWKFSDWLLRNRPGPIFFQPRYAT